MRRCIDEKLCEGVTWAEPPIWTLNAETTPVACHLSASTPFGSLPFPTEECSPSSSSLSLPPKAASSSSSKSLSMVSSPPALVPLLAVLALDFGTRSCLREFETLSSFSPFTRRLLYESDPRIDASASASSEVVLFRNLDGVRGTVASPFVEGVDRRLRLPRRLGALDMLRGRKGQHPAVRTHDSHRDAPAESYRFSPAVGCVSSNRA